MRWNVHFECDISRGKWNNSIKGLKDAMRHNSKVISVAFDIQSCFCLPFLGPSETSAAFSRFAKSQPLPPH